MGTWIAGGCARRAVTWRARAPTRPWWTGWRRSGGRSSPRSCATWRPRERASAAAQPRDAPAQHGDAQHRATVHAVDRREPEDGVVEAHHRRPLVVAGEDDAQALAGEQALRGADEADLVARDRARGDGLRAIVGVEGLAGQRSLAVHGAVARAQPAGRQIVDLAAGVDPLELDDPVRVVGRRGGVELEAERADHVERLA